MFKGRKMLDFNGEELFIGDRVIFTMQNYTNLVRGVIKKIGAYCIVEYEFEGWNKACLKGEAQVRKPSEQIIKVYD